MPCYVAALITPVISRAICRVTSYSSSVTNVTNNDDPDVTPGPRGDQGGSTYCIVTLDAMFLVRVNIASQNCKFDLDRENVSVKFPNSAKTTRNLNLLLFKEVSKYLRM